MTYLIAVILGVSVAAAIMCFFNQSEIIRLQNRIAKLEQEKYDAAIRQWKQRA